MDSLVSIRNLVKTYTRGAQKVEVLHGIDVEIPKGDFVALMGPSGSGKTTLLNLIGGLDTPSSGSVSVAGQRIDQFSGTQLAKWRAENVGFVFQFYNLLPVLTAQKNVELPLLLKKMGAAERAKRANLALTLVGLGDRTSHKPKELSGGQEQRVAIARAIVTDPLVLLADEPTGNLDTARSHEIMELLTRLNDERDLTIIMVTHEPDMAAFAHRTIRFVDGHIESDTLREAA